jgi:hypothetical protein
VIYLGLEHELVEVLEDGLEKGLVKGVEKLIDKGLIKEIFQIAIDTIEQNISILIERGTIAAIATIAIENTIIPGIQKAIKEVENSSKEEAFKQIQNILINLLKKKYGDISSTELEQTIREICDVDKLSLLMEKIMDFDNLEAFILSMNNSD